VLYDKVGWFHINGSSVGFTNEGEVRVWHNKNHGVNVPEFPRNSLPAAASWNELEYGFGSEEAYMVRELLEIAEGKCEEGRFPLVFKRGLPDHLGFSTLRQIVDRYSQELDLQLPTRVDLFDNRVPKSILRRY
ncbi:unnamed protein product, partial [Sphagnum balticum]